MEFLAVVIHFYLNNIITARRPRMPFNTSPYIGIDWVHELVTGHPRRIRTQLHVEWSTFILLVKAMQSLGLQSSHHIPLEEQLLIFLYTAALGLGCDFVSERFQRSPSTITK